MSFKTSRKQEQENPEALLRTNPDPGQFFDETKFPEEIQ